jgi:hypothetical protein
MDDSSGTRDQTDEEILTCAVSDATLEAAAATKETEKVSLSACGSSALSCY